MDILIDYRPALRQRTGVGEYVHGLAAALTSALQREDTLTLFSSSWKDRLPSSVLPGARQIDARIPVRLLNFTWHRLEWPPIEALGPPPDVVHSPHPLLIPSRSAAQLVTIHDLYFLDKPEHTTGEIRRDYPDLARRHARRADGVIVNSRYTAAQVAERFQIDPERITVCYPGKPAWNRRTEPKALGPILFIGTAEPRKNLARLIQAYASLIERTEAPDLVIAGGAGASAESLLNAVRSTRQLRTRVRFTGYITDAERYRLLSEASMLALPSLDEGFGITALEAMTAGVPVVASRRGALPEVLQDAGILADPEDVPGLSAALERVLADPQLRQAMSDKGVTRAAQFSWQASAEQLYAAYRAALTRRNAR